MRMLILALGALCALGFARNSNGFAQESGALEAQVVLKLADGTTQSRTYPLEERDGAQILTVPAADIPEGALTVDAIHPWQTAKSGEDGFFILPNGMYGTWRDLPNGEYVNRNSVMQTYGVKTPRGALAAILTGMNYEATERVVLRDGTWRVFVRYELEGDKPYEDFRIEYHVLHHK